MDIKIIGKDVKRNDPRYINDVDYTSPAVFNKTISPHIGHRECEMLLQNLADVGYPEEKVREVYAAPYGFAVDHSAWENVKTYPVASTKIRPQVGQLKGTWNDEEFDAYKMREDKENPGLYERMTNSAKNYTFILAKDDNGKTIGLVSFNAPEDKSQLRVFNFTVHRDHRSHSSKIVRALSREIMRYAMEHGFEKAPINAPVSNYATEKGNNVAYRRLADLHDVPNKEESEPDQKVLTFTPCDLDVVKPLDHAERIRRRKLMKATSRGELGV